MDKLRALERKFADGDPFVEIAAMDDLADLLPQIVAKMERDSADAKRYRWLREHDWLDTHVEVTRHINPAEPETLDRRHRPRYGAGG